MTTHENFYRISDYCMTISKNNKVLIYHSILGNGIILDKPSWNKIVTLAQKKIIHINSQTDHSTGIINDLIEKSLLVKKNTKYQYPRLSNWKNGEWINFLVLNVSNCCNMQCRYCFVYNSTKSTIKENKKEHMPLSTAIESVDKFIELFSKNAIKKKNLIRFFGGEPLLNWPIVYSTIEYLKTNYNLDDHKIVIDIVTNGTLITDKIAKYLGDSKIKVGLSLDGVGPDNDINRVMLSGVGSFNKVNEGLLLLKKYNANVVLNATVTTPKFKNLKSLIDFAENNEVKFVNISNAMVTRDIKNTHINSTNFAKIFIDIVNYGSKKGIVVGGMLMRPFLDLFTSRKPSGKFCAGMGRELSVNPDGSIAVCAGLPHLKGSLHCLKSFFTSKEYENVVQRTVSNLDECAGCEIEGLCCGGCAAGTYDQYHHIDKATPYCNLMKTYFRELAFNLLDNHTF